MCGNKELAKNTVSGDVYVKRFEYVCIGKAIKMLYYNTVSYNYPFS